MVVFSLFLLSCAGVILSLVTTQYDPLLMPAGLSALLFLIAYLSLLRRRQRTLLRGPLPWVVVDGSNVMHWQGGGPRLDTVREVVDLLAARGLAPLVFFDANAGYLLTGHYQQSAAFGRALALPEDQIVVVDRGSSADPRILSEARNLNARIVSNDLFRNWTDDHPEIREDGFLLRGGYRKGRLWISPSQVVSLRPEQGMSQGPTPRPEPAL